MSFKRKALAALMALTLLSLEANGAPAGDFEDFYDGAMGVYAEKINPSVDVSNRFHKHLLKMYFVSKCNDTAQCYASGENAANQFVNNLTTKDERYGDL